MLLAAILIFGIEEREGRAVAAEGLGITNIDAELLRLDQMIRAGIAPRIVGCQIHTVQGLTKGPAVVIRVPRSWSGPHIIAYQQDFRFYSRSTNGKFRMDASDVRAAVLQSANVEERIRAFRVERLGRIGRRNACGIGRHQTYMCARCALSSLRRSAGGRSRIGRCTDILLGTVLSEGYSGPIFNIDGFYTHDAAAGSGASGGYHQVFRSGIVEAVDAWMIPSRSSQYPDSIPSLAFPQHLFTFVERAEIRRGLVGRRRQGARLSLRRSRPAKRRV